MVVEFALIVVVGVLSLLSMLHDCNDRGRGGGRSRMVIVMVVVVIIIVVVEVVAVVGHDSDYSSHHDG